MKFLTLLASVVMIALYVQAELPIQRGNEGKAGGGTNRNGRPQTFYSAGIVTGLQPLTRDEIPQMNEFHREISEMKYLSPQLKFRILQSTLPSDSRQYFPVLENHFDAETESRLKAEYARLTKQDPSTLVLFAVTDTNTNTTYLLPNFFKLENPSEQKAILGHEGYWVANPSSNYKKVLNVEYAYQDLFENPQNINKLARLISLVGTDRDYFKFAIEVDRDHGNLKDLFVRGETKLKELLGSQFLFCASGSHSSKCNDYAYDHLNRLSLAYPNSKLIPFLMKVFNSNESWSPVFGGSRPGYREYWDDVDELKLKMDISNLTVRLEHFCTTGDKCGLVTIGKYDIIVRSRGNNPVSEFFGQYGAVYSDTDTVKIENLYFVRR